MMHMTFYWGTTVTILFDSWKTNSWFSYLLSLFACFLISVFYQYMEDRRLRLKLRSLSKTSTPSSVGTPLFIPRLELWEPSRLTEAILFGINSAIGYMLMLAVMSFNGGVFIVVVVGLGVGYLVFRSGDHDQDVVLLDNPCRIQPIS